VLQCVAVCYSVSQCVAVCCSVSQCVTVCRSVLQCVAVCCSVLQCVLVATSLVPPSWCTVRRGLVGRHMIRSHVPEDRHMIRSLLIAVGLFCMSLLFCIYGL